MLIPGPLKNGLQPKKLRSQNKSSIMCDIDWETIAVFDVNNGNGQCCFVIMWCNMSTPDHWCVQFIYGWFLYL